MRSFLTAPMVAATLALGGVANAQTVKTTTSTPVEDAGYVEVVAQSAFGNVTSQSYGLEAGFTIRPQMQVFVEAGQTRSVATAELSTSAQTIAGALSRTQNNVGYTAKEPATFGDVGIRYSIAVSGRARPYVLGGFGLASVKRNVAFTVGGTDVTSSLSQDQYGNIVLGTDLSGSETKAMFVVGAGLALPAWERLIIDLQFRYGRIFAEDAPISVARAGIGIGVRF
jgi:opacity protein-like surface antigen